MSNPKRFLDVMLSQQHINLEQHQQLQQLNFPDLKQLWQHLQAVHQFSKGDLMHVLVQHIRLPDAQQLLMQREMTEQALILPQEYRLVTVRNTLELQPAREFLQHYPQAIPEAIDAIKQAHLLTPGNIALAYVELHLLLQMGDVKLARQLVTKLALKPQEQPIINRLIAYLEFKEQHHKKVIQLLLPQLPKPMAAEWLWLLAISGLECQDFTLCTRALTPISLQKHYLQNAALQILTSIKA